MVVAQSEGGLVGTTVALPAASGIAAGAGASPSPASGTVTAASYPSWQGKLLTALGADPTNIPANQALNLWAQSEGVAGIANNPLAICCHPAGSTGCIALCLSTSPIYSYGTEDAGVAATTAFMSGSNSSGIVAALRAGTSLASIFAAINGSSWCKGCQNGAYPVALAAAVNGKAPTSIFKGAGAGSVGSGTNEGGTTPGCSSGSKGIDIFGAHIFNACEVKAITGGLLVAAGGLVLLVGASLMANAALKGTAAGQGITKAAAKITPVGRAAGIATKAAGSRIGTARATREANRRESIGTMTPDERSNVYAIRSQRKANGEPSKPFTAADETLPSRAPRQGGRAA
jgi:hypothetical protein